MIETSGKKDCETHRGDLGEIGCYQYKKSTWEQYSKDVIGYVVPMSDINTKYVATVKVQEWLDEGQTPERIFMNWNAGEGKKHCSKGTNKGVYFDSCSYIKKGLSLLNN